MSLYTQVQADKSERQRDGFSRLVSSLRGERVNHMLVDEFGSAVCNGVAAKLVVGFLFRTHDEPPAFETPRQRAGAAANAF